ncbi:undecaprenyl/decaprenyl-phosphate alpha-N-acetylglucosaminyl 1-phosphate transferase [Marinilongibacter aquaticus]|uniref:glycosyltransferase family 4 protein n=1 Tax=Marinilongibacter aquaticus TaxID=2975157 RepID=UPI0021BDEFF5|nr:MraY family glycosyltransferase [Marinilongibacter aquaticus]UBM59442.1 undecaprenyl/decaprenyl-phosphate alpha-N-acetylglucosaminyl 1-phosphate transferase [Marinilongibacter aquaticus]
MSLVLEELIADQNIQIILSMVIALTITWRSIPVIRNICQIRNLLENPVKRSSHSSPTPTFGGVGIFAGTLTAYLIWNFEDEGFLLHKVLAGLIGLFFLGLKDDLFALAPLKKLASQIIISVLVVVGSNLCITSFFGIFGIYEIPYFVGVVLTVFIFVAMINSFNLIDGIDGLAGGIGMISSAGFGLWFMLNQHWSLACLSLSLSASLLGFLRYNYSKTSKIFMGDTGSLMVGFIVTMLAVKFITLNQDHNFSPNNHYVSAPVLVIVLLSVPIFDSLRVFGLRILKRKSPFKPDRLHIHHLLVDNGMSHLAASLSLYTMTIVLTVFTYYLRSFFTNTALSLYVAVIFAVYLAVGSWLELRRFRMHRTKKAKEVSGQTSPTRTLGLGGSPVSQN